MLFLTLSGNWNPDKVKRTVMIDAISNCGLKVRPTYVGGGECG